MTYYEVLNVSMDADLATIKKAYRREALKNHPDVSKDPMASDRFLEVQNAYKMLSDPKLRARYDNEQKWAAGSGARSTRTSEEARRRRAERDGPFPEDLGDSFGSIFSDIFSSVSKVASDVVSGVSSGGVASDFIEFLESQFSTSTGQELDEMLRHGTLEEIKAELSDTIFVLEQLVAREKRLKEERKSAERLAKEWRVRSEREHVDLEARSASAERAQAFDREISRVDSKLREVKSMMAKQEATRSRLEVALSAKEGTHKAKHDANSARTSARLDVKLAKDKIKEEVDEELQRMKRELGM